MTMNADRRLAALADAIAPLPADALVPVSFVRRHVEDGLGSKTAGPRGEQLLDVGMIAKMLDRSPSTARALCASGEIDAFKLRGREWRATCDNVRAFLDAERERHKAESESFTDAPRSRGPHDLGDWRKAFKEVEE